MARDVYDSTKVILIDSATGLPSSGLSKASAGAQASVVAATADTTILAANTARIGATVFNDSTAILYLLLSSAAASTTLYSVQLAAGAYYEAPFGYTGAVKGIWAAANGSARVTELT